MIGGESGDKAVTDPREWPNNARAAREQSAERIALAMLQLDKVLQMMEIEPDVKIRVYQAQRHLIEALRWLEICGAPTRPTEL